MALKCDWENTFRAISIMDHGTKVTFLTFLLGANNIEQLISFNDLP